MLLEWGLVLLAGAWAVSIGLLGTRIARLTAQVSYLEQRLYDHRDALYEARNDVTELRYRLKWAPQIAQEEAKNA